MDCNRKGNAISHHFRNSPNQKASFIIYTTLGTSRNPVKTANSSSFVNENASLAGRMTVQ